MMTVPPMGGTELYDFACAHAYFLFYQKCRWVTILTRYRVFFSVLWLAGYGSWKTAHGAQGSRHV